MNLNFRNSLIFVSMLGGLLFTANASAQLIEILCTETESCGKYTGVTADGTIFEAESNPTSPATGTGVFEPFVRIQQSSKTQSGYNTDTGNPDINFNTKAGSWTHSVLFGDLGTVEIGGLSYYQFSLDANESGSSTSTKNLLDILEMQIFVGDSRLATPEANGGYTGTQFYDKSVDNKLAGYDPVWSLDSATNGDVTVTLQSSICNTTGQCGSGKGDLNVFILDSMFSGNDSDNFVLYTEYDGIDSGFEEWRYLAKGISVPAPAPLVLALIGFGLIGLTAKRRNKNA